MSIYTMALFGEAEKGDYRTAYFCRTLPQLVDYLGNPPPHSRGLYFAIQALLYKRHLIFFRVKEEGFSYHDYMVGVQKLEQDGLISEVSAVCIPGVGDKEIIHTVIPLCQSNHAILITTEPDLYDYLTDISTQQMGD